MTEALMTRPDKGSRWARLVKSLKLNFEVDISGLRDWLVSQGLVPANMPADWDLVWTNPDGRIPPEELAKQFSAVEHLRSPGHGWIPEGAAPESSSCRMCGISTAIWLCYMAAAEAEKEQTYVTEFAKSLGKLISLVEQGQRSYSKAFGEYSDEYIARRRQFLEDAKTLALAERPREQVVETVQYLENLRRNPAQGTTVRLMKELHVDLFFEKLGSLLRSLQDDVLVDTRNPGFAQPGVVAKGRLMSLQTRVERCLLAVGFTTTEIGEQLIRSRSDPFGVDPESESSPDDGRDRGTQVRDRVRHRSRTQELIKARAAETPSKRKGRK
jgi:hypothetical protein